MEINKEKIYVAHGSALTGTLHQIASVICSERLLENEKVLLIADVLERYDFISESKK